jgi:hypothetical protein
LNAIFTIFAKIFSKSFNWSQVPGIEIRIKKLEKMKGEGEDTSLAYTEELKFVKSRSGKQFSDKQKKIHMCMYMYLLAKAFRYLF